MIQVIVSGSSALVRVGLEAIVRDAGFALAASIEPGRLGNALAAVEADAILAAVDSRQDEVPGEFTAAAAGCAVVLLAAEPQPPWAAEALRSGIRGVIPADSDATEITAAIQAAASGLVVLHPQDVPALVAAPLTERASEAPGQSLTPRETEVLRLLADGEGNKSIAWKLGISDHTVKFHVASIMSKLNASSRTEAVTMGIRRGLIML